MIQPLVRQYFNCAFKTNDFKKAANYTTFIFFVHSTLQKNKKHHHHKTTVVFFYLGVIRSIELR
ncbi:MAG: hypothetical protein D8B60_04545 [Moraxella sp.]|nr:MAG: hypothetical protein D8B60_04545 [Moraxella sp.]